MALRISAKLRPSSATNAERSASVQVEIGERLKAHSETCPAGLWNACKCRLAGQDCHVLFA